MTATAATSRQDSSGPAAELVVLSVLGDGPLYGYAIAKQAAARSGGELRLSPGVLYPLLKALERDGLIGSSWETVRSERSAKTDEITEAEGEGDAAGAGGGGAGGGGGGGGRRRKWYRLTPRGRKRLTQRIAAHRAFVRMVDNFLRGAGGGKPEPEESRP